MAYNNSFPMNYPQPVYPQYPQQMYSQQVVPQYMPQQQNTPQIQNGGFINARSIDEARNYPVAPGNCVTFKIDNQPYVCEKSQGFSQLESPQFKVYRLVEEVYAQPIQETNRVEVPAVQVQDVTGYIKEDDIKPFRDDLEVIKQEIVSIKEQIKKPNARAKREDKEDD